MFNVRKGKEFQILLEKFLQINVAKNVFVFFVIFFSHPRSFKKPI